jgi:hypothetical protein
MSLYQLAFSNPNTLNQFNTQNDLQYISADESIQQDFQNNSITIQRLGDLFLPTKIMCYNVNNNFKINSIELDIGHQQILKINNTDFLNFKNYVEDITIDNENHKVYHLDKTDLFFKIKLIALQFHHVKINITTTGNAQNIKLNGIYTQCEGVWRRNLASNTHQDKIKILFSGDVNNYSSNQYIQLHGNGLTNGYILTGIDHTKINHISLYLNGLSRLAYDDKLSIRMNTKIINHDTIYVNLNNCNYNDVVSVSGLNTSSINDISLKLGLDNGYNNINFKIGYYSNNIFKTYQGMGGLLYSYRSSIGIRITNTVTPQQTNTFHQPQTIPDTSPVITFDSWEKKSKIIEGDIECPVTFNTLTDKYICCSSCHKNFDISIIENWVLPNKNCPHCRQNWTDFTIYKTSRPPNNVLNTETEMDTTTDNNTNTNTNTNIYDTYKINIFRRLGNIFNQ